MLLRSNRSVLVVVDVQERLLPAIHESERVVRNVSLLLKGADVLSVPVVVTEQYPRGLGPTVEPVASLAPPGSVVEKIAFGCAGEPAFVERLKRIDRPQVVLCGTEAHVCVLQTALGLLSLGYDLFLVADAVSSRLPANADLAIARMRGCGAQIVSTEMVLFEWMERAGTPEFKTISALIK